MPLPGRMIRPTAAPGHERQPLSLGRAPTRRNADSGRRVGGDVGAQRAANLGRERAIVRAGRLLDLVAQLLRHEEADVRGVRSHCAPLIGGATAQIRFERASIDSTTVALTPWTNPAQNASSASSASYSVRRSAIPAASVCSTTAGGTSPVSETAQPARLAPDAPTWRRRPAQVLSVCSRSCSRSWRRSSWITHVSVTIASAWACSPAQVAVGEYGAGHRRLPPSVVGRAGRPGRRRPILTDPGEDPLGRRDERLANLVLLCHRCHRAVPA